MPMADRDEAAKEAQGLRVGKEIWKWPPIWPYDEPFFKPKREIDAVPISHSSIDEMASMLSGVAQAPTATTEEEEKIKFDALQYWGEEQATVKTGLGPEAADKLKSHYSFYLRPVDLDELFTSSKNLAEVAAREDDNDSLFGDTNKSFSEFDEEEDGKDPMRPSFPAAEML
jgi:hypothetical protein